ncbi:AzlC family ABC transporter permease [Bifidobacterium mongoliense]|uniref:AzlC family ABC transporter permease n=1 Tax=Bifidobacterium mongoliense TaxID=518643 RepID=UPI00264912AB|nr:AzlC family ABC transporter permease [Bifidobacterium mongoliense]MDN5980044.1 AzlC family ABC transporter permease [Bifidobacterium mongoliense]MDN6554210.1 AzlC family ABC transporter permease [Bifidobacterium mongoliense]MDN6768681.1 AzlC family ABC transporter permease [Bifidobacterium mongoliense]MDN6783060.1 AzlC family ABC transporter permease [Bifidobacterium mongoliense]
MVGTGRSTWRFAFRQTLPILAGFLFIGFTYGLYMHQEGFNFLYPTFMALTIFGGSVEFVIANLLTKAFDPWAVLAISLIINSRHVFYAIAMLRRYGHTGWRKPLLIFGMCDETFAINSSTRVPDGVDRVRFMTYVTVLNQLYWVGGAMLGGLFGGLMPVRIEGLSFVMTALFIVIFVNQLMRESSHVSSVAGVVLAIACLLLTGKQAFLPLSLVLVVVLFVMLDHGRWWHSVVR